MPKQRMSFKDAMDLTPDDLPDGAFFAMAHEIAGLEYGDGFDELADVAIPTPPKKTKGINGSPKPIKCLTCRKRFWSYDAMQQHRRDAHKE